MTNHDWTQDLEANKEVVEEINKQFNEYNFDFHEIMQHSKDPVFLAALMFKVAQERKQTNDLLVKLNAKYDKILKRLEANTSTQKESSKPLAILPEQDQHILNLIQNKGSTTAVEVQKALHYKGKNGASQRLSKLHALGYLKKAQAGKIVHYYANT
jgi:uncharacterized membrane protein